jgi:hypothetical protein
MSSEPISPRPDFDRRRKSDRTIDSICLHCCATVAVSSSETVLTEKEDSHWCWQRQNKMSRQLDRKAS